jgi:hypothetical protein
VREFTERVDGSVRERYRRLMGDDAKRRYRIYVARERLERERLIDRYSAGEVHGEEPGDE